MPLYPPAFHAFTASRRAGTHGPVRSRAVMSKSSVWASVADCFFRRIPWGRFAMYGRIAMRPYTSVPDKFRFSGSWAHRNGFKCADQSAQRLCRGGSRTAPTFRFHAIARNDNNPMQMVRHDDPLFQLHITVSLGQPPPAHGNNFPAFVSPHFSF